MGALLGLLGTIGFYAYETGTALADRSNAELRAQVAGGVDPGRIVSVLAAVENTRGCDEKPVSRRFLVRAGARGPAAGDSVAFADRTITVTAVGEPAIDGDGRPQGWFEPAKPVTFTRIGGAESAKAGVLPLHHAVVVNDVEHRFVVIQGDARWPVRRTRDRRDPLASPEAIQTTNSRPWEIIVVWIASEC